MSIGVVNNPWTQLGAPSVLETSPGSNKVPFASPELSGAEAKAVQALVSTPGIVARVCTIATLGAAGDYTGGSAYVTDLGGGAVLVSNGVRWRPRDGRAMIRSMDVRAASTASAETILFSAPLPCNATSGCLVKNGDRLRLTFSQSITGGTAETVTTLLRFGPLGTTADALLLSSAFLASLTNISAGVVMEWRRDSATSLQKMGQGSAANSYGGVSTAVFLPVVTGLTNMDSATALSFSIGISKTAAAQSVAIEGAELEWIASTNG